MKLPLGIILVGGLVVGAGACASSGGGGGVTEDDVARALAGEEAEELETGESIRNNEMTRAARDQLERAEEAAPEDAAEMYRAVVDVTEEAIELDPTNPLPWFQGGRAHLKLRNLEEADSMLDRAEELRPIYKLDIDVIREREWIDIYQEGVPLVNSGQLDAAAELFEGANLIYDQRPEGMVVLGQVYARQRRAPESIEVLQRALDIINSPRIEEVDSATAATWRQQAEDVIPLTMTDMFLADERYEEAAGMLRDLMAEDPDNLLLKQNLANVYLRLEMPDSAARIYEEMAARPGLSNTDLFLVGAGFYNLEDYDRAIEVFQRAVDRSEWDRDAVELLATTLVEAYPLPSGDEPEAPRETLERLMEASERWVELDPYSSRAHLIAAQTAQRLGDNQRASELITAAEELPVNVTGLQYRPGPGGGDVVGQIFNLGAEAGATVRMTVTFYGTGGSPIGTETITINAPEQEMAELFQVPFDTQEEVAGYTYSLEF